MYSTPVPSNQNLPLLFTRVSPMFYILFAHLIHSIAIFFFFYLDRSMNVKVIGLFSENFPRVVNGNHIEPVSLKSTFSVTNVVQRALLPLPIHMQIYLALITTGI